MKPESVFFPREGHPYKKDGTHAEVIIANFGKEPLRDPVLWACHENVSHLRATNFKTIHYLLIIKISDRSFTQRFDDSMSSFASEKRIKFDNLMYTVQSD